MHASKGVILSAGAVFTPQLLQVSGVGPKKLLEKLGVQLVVDLPVGRNFTDRLVIPVVYVSPTKVPLSIVYTMRVDEAASSVIETVGGGEVTTELAITSIALVAPKLRIAPLREALKLIFGLLPPPVLDLINQMIQPNILQTNTHSRGWVEARSKHIWMSPEVTANYFADQRDWMSQKTRFNELLRLGETQAMLNYTIDKVSVQNVFRDLVRIHAPVLEPALSCFFRAMSNEKYTRLTLPCLPSPYDSQMARDQYLRDYLVSSYHYFGTAAAGDVVNGKDFSVKGTKGLYVVDASVIPFPTTVNPQGTIMALGHYIGKMLSEQA